MRLPRSASRSAIAYLKLLSGVRVNRIWGGFDFEGTLFRPGLTVDESELRPEPRYPAVPLVLECAGPESGGWGHRHAPTLYLLWRYDVGRGEFREIARTAARNRDWTFDLGPIARRELEPPGPVLVDPAGAAARVMAALDHEVEKLDRQAERLILLAAYDRIAARVAEG